MISDFFIARPVLANVLAILMVVIGAVAVFALPVAQYPDVVPPTVQVTTRYPGASARTVIDTVALPIEQQVNGVQDMIYMQSYSGADGSYSLTVTFKIGADLDIAQVLVQNRVSSALSSLPQAVQAQGVIVQKNSTAILQIVTLTSPDGRYDSLYLANYATIKLKDEIARLPGVGNVVVFGAGQYSMRIWLDPNKMQGARAHAPGRHRGVAAAEHASDGGADRRATGAARPNVPIHPQRHRPAQRPGPIRAGDRQDRPRRRDHAAQ
jgi:hydrophobic/amphiphilic exporter-1 (mainly G- bacteria), HAE1 family